MSQAPPSSARIREEQLLMRHRLDFSAAYMGVKYIRGHVSDYPFTITRHTRDALFSVFSNTRFKKAKQAFFYIMRPSVPWWKWPEQWRMISPEPSYQIFCHC